MTFRLYGMPNSLYTGSICCRKSRISLIALHPMHFLKCESFWRQRASRIC